MTAPHAAPRLALLGIGYMGGSLALAARRAGLASEVIGYDPSPDAGAIARTRGIVDALAGSAAEAARGAGVVLLAGPVASLGTLAAEIAATTPAEALVMDIGSVKAPVIAAVEATALAGRFVGCHPLAGQEVSGPQHADERLYEGKPCFLCPGPKANRAAVERAEAFWRAIGATLLTMDATDHDAFMAAASHLPHVGAFCVAASLAGVADMLEATVPVSCPPTSLRDTTRVAASSPVIWRDIFLENRAPLLPLVRELERRVGELRAAMEGNDGSAIERLLETARACRRRVVKPG